MTIKRITCILLSLILVLSLAACSSAPKGNGSTDTSDVDIDSLANARRINFPEPGKAYDTVLSNVQMDMLTFDMYLARMVVAYDSLSDQEFCKYIYELNTQIDPYIHDTFSAITAFMDGLSADVPDQTDIIHTISSFLEVYSDYMVKLSQWNMRYLSVNIAEDAPTYADLKAEMKDAINLFSNMLYAQDMI